MVQSVNNVVYNAADVVPTVVFRIKIHDHYSKPFRAIFDSGAQLNLISYDRVGELKMKRTAVSHDIRGVDGSRLPTKGKLMMELYHRSKDIKIADASFVVIKNLLAPQPPVKLDDIDFEAEFDKELLADPNYQIPANIDAVFGAGMLAKHLGGQMIRGPGAVIRQFTNFGWIIFGENTTKQDTEKYCMVTTATAELNELIQKLWEVNEKYKPLPLSDEDQYCLDEFARTTVRKNGRYVVTIPLKPDARLGESRHMALRRLIQIEAKCKRNPEYHLQYVDFMREYIRLGHMIKANPLQPEALHCYICHHAVAVDRKFRVVFDGSVPTTNGNSLNSIQCSGPKLQRDLLDLVMSFRMGRVAFSADIVKMYRQVAVNSSQWDLQRILWREKPTDPIVEYWLTTVTYGETAAPFMAVSALIQCANDFEKEYPRAAKVVKNNFYMDDLLCSVDTEKEAIELKQELTELLGLGGFELAKWTSNSRAVVNQDSDFKSICEKDNTSVLGVSWACFQDEFQFNIEERGQPQKLTKRVIASESARIFDPQGYLSPVTIRAKLLIQELWKAKCEWDAPVPASAHGRWTDLQAELANINHIQVPRWLGIAAGDDVQVHLFSDASELGYGITAYVRVYHNKKWTSNLLCSRSKVAPVKTITIPRLELCALELITQLVPKLRDQPSLENASYFYWTDSEVVLKWLRKSYGVLRIFVANRVEKIKEIAEVFDIRHVVSAQNPADLLTRGISVQELNQNQLWWHGPEFLKEDRNQWPVWQSNRNNKEIENVVKAEYRRVTPSIVYLTYLEADRRQELIEKYSSFHRLCVVTAHITRFINGFCKRLRYPPCNSNPAHALYYNLIKMGTAIEEHQIQTRSRTQKHIVPRLSAAEIHHARRYWIRKSQQESFPTEYQRMMKGRLVLRGSRLQKLVPLMDDDNIMRITGRLNKVKAITSLETQPILLCYKSRVARRIVEEAHRNLCHGGAHLTMQYLRQRYWIVGMGILVNSVIHQCVICVRYRQATARQLMADIPRMRLIPGPAFESCGVDYAGPITIRESRNVTTKAYIAVFICMKYKAVHLELVSALNSDALLAALSRFINLRAGQVKFMYSDHGSNFVGGNNIMRAAVKLWEASPVINFLQENHITWRFIPPAAPHHGGLWEAAVKSTKAHLKRMVGVRTFRFEELATLLAKIGACLNSRPITPMSSDPTDLTALTPGHFLTGQPILAPYDEPMHDQAMGPLTSWRLIKKMEQEFWDRWSQEYVTLQQRRNKNAEYRENLLVGDCVLIKDEQTPPCQWLMGRIIKNYAGTDGLVRSCRVQTAYGQLDRSIVKLCLLPFHEENENEDN